MTSRILKFFEANFFKLCLDVLRLPFSLLMFYLRRSVMRRVSSRKWALQLYITASNTKTFMRDSIKNFIQIKGAPIINVFKNNYVCTMIKSFTLLWLIVGEWLNKKGGFEWKELGGRGMLINGGGWIFRKM